MLKTYKKSLFLTPLLLLTTALSWGQNLVHYWNFNNSASESTITTPSQTFVSGASLTAIAGGISKIEFASGTGQNFSTLNINTRNSDEAGTHLRFNDPIGGGLLFSLPTTGFENVVVKFATRRSGSGAGNQLWSYTTDGTTFVSFATINPNEVDPELATLDFSALTAVNDNPNFKLKVEFEAGAGGTKGNNRFDNFTLDATTIPVPVLIHYWNFNNSTSESTITTPSQTFVSGASLIAIAGGISKIEFASGTGQNFSTLNINTRNSDEAGTHLRFNDPIGGGLLFSLPTTGFENIVVKFATRRSGSGAGNQLWSYTTDGATFVSFATINPNELDPELATLDFSALTAVNDNPNFKLKVEFEAGAGGTKGNNRFDNFTIDGNVIGGSDAIAPVAIISPANGTMNVNINEMAMITFNENVRMANDDAITNDNIDAVVELRLNDASGALVPFDATFADNTITITPTTALANSQSYYVALLPNLIEDFANNAITTKVESTFTTISVQTQFQAGDIAITGYRMNASSTDDEIAFVTFVDIIPGTFINFADAKYTSNATAQCAGGIVWTAGANDCIPAGSVITIQTSAMLANKGTVTGAGFGLSSGGDQVIVYTGSNTSPNYITALSSNGWVADNTYCSGSLSMLPMGLIDGQTALNTSTASGSVEGNTVNAYYYGIQTGTPAELRTAILNPTNWIGADAGTTAQTWPTWNFPSTLQVLNTVVLNNTTLVVTFNANVNVASASNLVNYIGINNLGTVSITDNVATLTYTTPFASGTNYTLMVANVLDANGETMTCNYSFTFDFNTSVSLSSNFITVNENAGTLNFVINLVNPAAGSVDLVVKGAPFGTADANDFTLSTQTLTFDGSSSLTQSIAIPIIDDTQEEQQAEYFVLSLENPVGLTITGTPTATIYIKDNDRLAPVATKEIELNYIGSFDPSGTNSSTCEIVVHDATTQRLFTTSAIAGFLDIIDFSDPTDPKVISSIDMKVYGGVTSVAVKNGIIAVASPNTDESLNGSVVFFDIDGVFQNQVTVGALPDMVTFTPDGTKVITANEGQPSPNYSVDPEGSVSVIDISGGITSLTQANVSTLLFTAFNAQEASLIASGVRKTKASSTLSQDLEPEYVTVAADSKKAYVSLQENNAIAEIDLMTVSIANVWALGTKDMSKVGNGFDVSDSNNEILIANWPVKTFYQPDGIANYTVNGTNYIITANEGDEKEYTGLVERTTFSSSSYTLDAAVFPNASVLKESYNMGRFRVTNLDGNTDADADFEEIYALGARSFSIFNTTTKEIVYDSGDDFEMYTAANFPTIFNAEHESNNPKGRSHAKGPEPEGVTTATIGGQTFAFISLERVGGVMVYNITDPNNVSLVDYKNTRSTSAYEGDHGPEGITFISAENSPTGKGYILVANEISGTITIFEVDANTLSTTDYVKTENTFSIFPNPSVSGIVYFNRTADYDLFDINGKKLLSAKRAQTINTSSLSTGLYFVKTSEGIVKKLVVK